MERQKLLFVCGRNKWRSPTAERIFAHSTTFEVRARGLSASAVRRLSAADVSWADVVFVMEASHKRQLLELFRSELARRPVHVLDIPDEYQFMDPELIGLLHSGVHAVLDQPGEPDQEDSEDSEDSEDIEDTQDFEGTLVLEQLATIDKVDDFFEAIDSDDFARATALMRRAKIDPETIAVVVKKMKDGDTDH